MYKGQSGMFAWLFHRIAGLGILLFSCLDRCRLLPFVKWHTYYAD
jgi:succinate dehydrogenase/fumarate reductase cytochrome b subunit